MKKIYILVLSLIVYNIIEAQTVEDVSFSASGGFYESVFQLRLTNNNPTAQSELYKYPLVLNATMYSKSDIYTIQVSPEDLMFVPDSVQHCIVVRAAVFDNSGHRVSDVVTNSYFIKELGCDTHGLPVVSLCSDSLDLFDYNNGIFVPGAYFNSSHPNTTGNYYQSGSEWERIINVEYIDPNENSAINQICGLRTHGNRARHYPQKGMKLYAREEYGTKRFNHKFFEESSIESYKRLIIKPFSTLWPYNGVEDYVCTNLAKNIGLETQNQKPVTVFINGEYWGIYFLQEKLDDHYLKDHFGFDNSDYNIVKNWDETEAGDAGIAGDSFDVFANATYTSESDWPSSSKATLIFRKLLERSEYKQYLKQRAEYLCNNYMFYDTTSFYLYDLKNTISGEIQSQSDRFGYPRSLNYWNWTITVNGDFLQNGVANYMSSLDDFLNHIGISEETENSIVCYPNPTKDVVYIKGDVVYCEVLDVLGKQVLIVSTNVEEICVSNLSSGIYMMRFMTRNGNTITRKIIKR